MTELQMFSDGHDWIIAKNMKEVKSIYSLMFEQEINNIKEWTELDSNKTIKISMDVFDFISQFNSNQLPKRYELDLVGERIVIDTKIIEWLIITKEPTHFMSLDY